MRTALVLLFLLGCSKGASEVADFPGDYLGDKNVLKIHAGDAGLTMDVYALPAADKGAQAGMLYQVERRDSRLVASGTQGATSFSATRTADGLDAVIEGQRQTLRRVDLTTGTTLSADGAEKLARESLSKVLEQVQAEGRCGKNPSAPTPASQRVVEQLSHVLDNAAMIQHLTKSEGLLVDRYESRGHLMVPGGKGSQPADVPYAFTVRMARGAGVALDGPAFEWTRLGDRLPAGLDARAVCTLRAPNWLNVTGVER